MQHLGNDMDNLFRKAADAYPLNTGGADWEKLKVLLAQSKPKEEVHEKKPFRWLLFLVLPFVFLGNPLSDGLPFLQAAGKISSGLAGNGNTGSPTTPTTPAVPRTITGHFAPPSKKQSISPRPSAAGVVQRIAKITSTPVLYRSQDRHQSAVITAQQTDALTSVPESGTTSGNALSLQWPDSVSRGENRVVGVPSTAGETFRPEETLSPAEEKPEKEKKPSAIKEGRFFVSLVGGPDISTVKFQRFSEVGFHAGILLGYRLGKNLSVEAGALTAEKHYYTKGDYFEKYKLRLPPNTKLIAVDGDCRMIELPVLLRYAFAGNKRKSWFAAAGLSSYLMQAENYRYDYVYLPGYYPASYHKTYKNESRNWLSVVQFSAGFTSTMGKIGSLRVEPYYSLPLKGAGYGELPLSSIGLRLGLTSPRF